MHSEAGMHVRRPYVSRDMGCAWRTRVCQRTNAAAPDRSRHHHDSSMMLRGRGPPELLDRAAVAMDVPEIP